MYRVAKQTNSLWDVEGVNKCATTLPSYMPLPRTACRFCNSIQFFFYNPRLTFIILSIKQRMNVADTFATQLSVCLNTVLNCFLHFVQFPFQPSQQLSETLLFFISLCWCSGSSIHYVYWMFLICWSLFLFPDFFYYTCQYKWKLPCNYLFIFFSLSLKALKQLKWGKNLS